MCGRSGSVSGKLRIQVISAISQVNFYVVMVLHKIKIVKKEGRKLLKGTGPGSTTVPFSCLLEVPGKRHLQMRGITFIRQAFGQEGHPIRGRATPGWRVLEVYEHARESKPVAATPAISALFPASGFLSWLSF